MAVLYVSHTALLFHVELHYLLLFHFQSFVKAEHDLKEGPEFWAW
jgi:hypothetical protein